ncbi:hypothetical protein HPB48_011677 [Haemaphysalis longicornis]|uniref:ATP-dependent DNA helicase n=1 Tax=Haemaphysalis longicornis TaxID=44386 RepID=A0A9J6GYZ8_HAELO|nr:hypothetical protein HPB48_011677 [Haemaphysalis longicornis]
MSGTRNAASNATCNASVNANADLIPSQDLVRLIKQASPCSAVRKRQDIMDRDEYYNLVRMMNAEQHELLRDIIDEQTTPSAPPLRVIFTGLAGCDGPLQEVRQHRQQHRYNAFFICASTGKAAVAVGGTTMRTSFKLSRKTTGPNKDGGLSASELNTFRVAFRNVKFVITDEVSDVDLASSQAPVQQQKLLLWLLLFQLSPVLRLRPLAQSLVLTLFQFQKPRLRPWMSLQVRLPEASQERRGATGRGKPTKPKASKVAAPGNDPKT